MPESVVPGDTTYAATLAAWIDEGRPGQFDEHGSFGYRRYLVQVTDDADNPNFLLRAADGPTSTGYDEDTEEFKSAYWPGPRSGSRYTLKDSGIEHREGPTGQLVIKMHPQPRDITV